ncbi:ubiquinol oxidase (non-electrogenic) [Ranunculus cassubicifolius]
MPRVGKTVYIVAERYIGLSRHCSRAFLTAIYIFLSCRSLRILLEIVKVFQFFGFSTWSFLRRRYGCREMMLETVAAVPGMVGGMLLHCKSLRRFEHSGRWIKALLEEAVNERMHLMTFMEVAKPRWYERALVMSVQGVFFHAYLLAYIVSPKFAHRNVGYLEEEATHSYTEFLKELDKGTIENVPAPAIAIDYWRLPPNSTLRDVVMVVRADEAHHRDVKHFASDIHYQGHELRETAAPVGYH